MGWVLAVVAVGAGSIFGGVIISECVPSKLLWLAILSYSVLLGIIAVTAWAAFDGK